MTLDAHQTDHPDPPGTDRRRHFRRDVNWDVRVELIVFEETFPPQPLSGAVKNLSRRGMQIFLPEIGHDVYRRLLDNHHGMKVSLDAPVIDPPFEAIGKVVWVDYRPGERLAAYCNVGLFFEELTPAAGNQLHALFAGAQ